MAIKHRDKKRKQSTPSLDSKRSGPIKVKAGKDGNPELVSVKTGVGALARTIGLSDVEAATMLLSQVVESAGAGEESRVFTLNAISPILYGIAPSDPLEGLLAVQMVAAHNAAMKFSKLAMFPGQTYEGHKGYGILATKFSRVFVAQLEALNKHRGKGEQKVEVKHVHVHEGGQAIVGHVSQGGEGCACENGRTTPCAEAEPPQKQQPAGRLSKGAAVRSDDPERQALPRPRDEERTLPLARRSEPGSPERQQKCLAARAEIGSGD